MNNKILVVDDDPAVRKMMALLFETTCEVLLASAGEEALRIVGAQRPRLMLLDMTMPGMGGLEVLKASRAVAPAMTVIMLTGKSDVALALQALELGAVEYVTKPFDMGRLKDKVKRSLETLSPDDRNNHGLPWRIIPPESSPVSVPGQIATAQEGLPRWDGEGGSLAPAAASCDPAQTEAAWKPRLIGREELKAMIDDDEQFRLWNVAARDFLEPEAGIAGSRWIPADAITAELASVEAPLKSESLVVYCGESGCPSSNQAAEKLRDLGYTSVFVYEGGIRDWFENGLPLVKLSSGVPPMEIK